jgi:hypothetical protein
MKKITASVIVITFLAFAAIFNQPAHAADHIITIHTKGANCSNSVTFDPPSITINSGETVSFILPKDDPSTDGVVIKLFPGGDLTVVPGAQPKSTPSLVIDVPNYYATPTSKTCQTGSGSVTVKQVTTPQPTPPPPPPPTKVTLSPAAAAATANKPPDILKLDQAMMNGEKIDLTKAVSFDKSKSLTISGYTIPNGVIDLTIHSTVRNEIVRADSNGKWSFVIENLEPGNHTLEAKVTNQATHLTSENTTLLKFAVTGKASPANGSSVQGKNDTSKTNNNMVVLISIIVVVLAVLAGIILWRIKKTKKTNKQNEPSISPEPLALPAPPTEIKPIV